MANYRYYKRYCKDIENVENFEKAKADNFKGWCCHHRMQTWTSDGKRREVDITAAELIALDMYYDRPAEELIFLTESEHTSLHQKGKRKSVEHNMRNSEAHKGKQFSEEHRKKLSDAKKNISDETKKKMSEAAKNRSTSHRNKISEAKKGKPSNTKGMHWYHNDVGNIMAKECPPGYEPGMLRK